MSSNSQDLVNAWLEFSTPLRMKGGFNEYKYRTLTSVLSGLASEWQGLEHIPRRAVNVLVDIFPAMESTANIYNPETKNRITEAMLELQDLIQECVSVDDTV